MATMAATPVPVSEARGGDEVSPESPSKRRRSARLESSETATQPAQRVRQVPRTLSRPAAAASPSAATPNAAGLSSLIAASHFHRSSARHSAATTASSDSHGRRSAMASEMAAARADDDRGLFFPHVLQPEVSAHGVKIVSYNVHALLPRALAYMDVEEADVYLLQDVNLDAKGAEGLDWAGMRTSYPHRYWSIASGTGVAKTGIVSRHEPLSVIEGTALPRKSSSSPSLPSSSSSHVTDASSVSADGGEMAPAVATWVSRMTGRHGRVLTIEFERCFIVNVNCPDCANVIEREAWDLALIDFVQALDRRKPVIIAGDFKAAHSSMDVRPPKKPSYVGFRPEERFLIDRLLQTGFTDVHRAMHPSESDSFTYFETAFMCQEKNCGWRFDYIFASWRVAAWAQSSFIRRDAYGGLTAHVPIGIVVELGDGADDPSGQV